MNDQGDSDSEHDSAHEETKSKPISERRRKHNAILAAWIKDKAEKQDEEEETKSSQDRRVIPDEEMSIKELMAQSTNRKIIESPREYQMELFERAKERNIIAVLDTGSGKTLIAALLIRWMLDQELEHRARGGNRRLVFFVVGNVALTFQQHAVLECNLDHGLEQLYGDKKESPYTPEMWKKIFKDKMGVVCTAEVLVQCLVRSFLKVSDINLLIFDEAHHAKKDHSFSRLMKDFYHNCPQPQRPKIFGMTASPVDAKVDVVQAAQDLEATLDAQIATTRNLTLLQSAISRPSEKVLFYMRLPDPYSTALTSKLATCFNGARFFEPLLHKAQAFTAHLGEWSGDHFWQLALQEDAGPKLENQYKRNGERSGNTRPTEEQNRDMALIEQARTIAKTHIFLPPDTYGARAISSKVEQLKRFLDAEFENSTQSKAIVFVDYRHIALLLVDLFKLIGTKHLRPGAMVGTRTPESGELPFSIGAQIRTLRKFELGELNCLFATTIAEEGLDVADCNLIVRFDLYRTMIQYVQSRGRARHRNSKYIHMLEQGTYEHQERLRMVLQSELKMREFCAALPEDRILAGNEADLEKIMAKEKAFNREYKIPETGATLNYHSALVILHHFVDRLPVDVSTAALQPIFIVVAVGSRFQCEVILPEQSPVRSVIGKLCSRKALAKRSAAFMACVRLKEEKLLDDHFMPTLKKKLPLYRNAQLALTESKTSAYTIRLKPELWQKSRGTVPSALYVIILDLESPGKCDRSYVPLALCTRKPLQSIPAFPLWPSPDMKTNAICTQLDDVLQCSSSLVTNLTTFTLRMFKDIFAKEYEHDEASMSYWLAPVLSSFRVSPTSSPRTVIDWETLQIVCDNECLKWDSSWDPEALVNRFIVDELSGARRFFTEAVEYLLKPSDRPPSNVAANKYMDTILDYSFSMWGKWRAEARFDPKQPVLRARKVLHRRDLFQEWTDKDKGIQTLAYICPEPLKISALPAPVVAMAYTFPAFISRIEAHMIAQEACDLLGLTIEPSLALEALTKDSDNTEEHRKEQLNVQRGMGRNYERLEFLGDSFLKMATSISVFTRNPGNDEFFSHVDRMVMICNANLYKHAVETKLYEYIRSQGFSRRTWYPEGLKLIKGKGLMKSHEEIIKKRLSDKTIADVCEAFIGAAFLTPAGPTGMDMAVKAVSATVASEDHAQQEWSEYYAAYRVPEFQTARVTAAQEHLALRVRTEHKYTFKYPRLLQSAFTHPSYPFSWDRIPNYQRFEFLGDALLDMVCVNFLFKRYPDRDPQWLTEHKMAMVSNKFLGALCVKLGFQHHLRSNHPQLMLQIKVYVDDITEAEKNSGGAMDYWTTVARDPPKCLPDIIEAFLGAMFVDSEYNYAEIERFFEEHVRRYFEDMSIYDTFANNHPIIALSGLLTETYECQDFRVMAQEVPTLPGRPARVCSVVIIHDRIVADAWSTSTRYGKVKAASKARHAIEGLAPYEYRAKFDCACAKGKDSDAMPLEQRLGTAL